MSLENILDQLDQEMQEEVASGGWKTIAKVRIHPGYCVFTAPPQHFLYSPGNAKQKEEMKQQATKIAEENGLKPSVGLVTVVDGKEVPTHPNGKFPDERDWVEFVSAWQCMEKAGENLSVAEKKAMGNAEMPYDAVMNALRQANAAILLQEAKWCQLGQAVDGYAKAKGNKRTYIDPQGNQKETDRRVYVVEKIFASKEEALEAVQKISGSSDSSGLSKMAKEQGWTVESLREMLPHLNVQITQAQKGVGTDGGKLKDGPLSPKAAKEYVAAANFLEPVDLDITPF